MRPRVTLFRAIALLTVFWSISGTVLSADPVPLTELKSGTTTALYGVCFISPSVGWAGGGSGTILSTTNGGSTWKAQKNGSDGILFKGAFPKPKGVWVVGVNGTVVTRQ